MTKSNNKIVNGKLVYKQFIQLDDGTEVQVRYNQAPELYEGTDVTLYAYDAKASKGSTDTVTKYAVAIEDAKRAKRASVAEQMQSLLKQGLTPEQIVAKFANV